MAQQNDRSSTTNPSTKAGNRTDQERSTQRDAASRSTEKDTPRGTSTQRGEVPAQGDARRGTDRNDRQNAEQQGRDWSNPPGSQRDKAPRAGANEGAADENPANNPNRDMDANRQGKVDHDQFSRDNGGKKRDDRAQ